MPSSEQTSSALRDLGWSPTVAAGLLQATSLPFLVTAATIGVHVGTISSVTGAALVSAGLLSVVIFPASALSKLRDATRSGASKTPTSAGGAPIHSEPTSLQAES
jgi:hypothetical protein